MVAIDLGGDHEDVVRLARSEPSDRSSERSSADERVAWIVHSTSSVTAELSCWLICSSSRSFQAVQYDTRTSGIGTSHSCLRNFT